MGEREIGPHVFDGRLFFVMPDNSTILCECIRDPYASQIVAMWRGEQPDDDDGVELGDRIVETLKYIRAI